MTVWLYDVSNHQSSTPSLNGWDGLIVKASEGSDFKDGRFRQHIDVAINQGKIHAGYHFLRSDSSVKSQFENFASVCPKSIAAIPDIESIKDRNGRVVSAPTPAQSAEFTDRLLQAGYNVPVHYLPPWYWSGPVGGWNRAYIGDWCTNLWPSYYPDYIARPRDQAWGMIPNSVKLPFGGAKAVPLVQFTSSPLDQNASLWSFDQLYNLFAGRAPGGGQGEQEMGYSFNQVQLPATGADPDTNEEDVLIAWQLGATQVQAAWVTLHAPGMPLIGGTGPEREVATIKFAHWVRADGSIAGEFLPDNTELGHHQSSGGREAPNDAQKLTVVYNSPRPLNAGVEIVTL
jgi:glycosyl hydrolase family 25